MGFLSVLSSLGKISLGDFEGGGMQPSESDRPARIQRAVEPTYPSSARRDGIEVCGLETADRCRRAHTSC